MGLINRYKAMSLEELFEEKTKCERKLIDAKLNIWFYQEAIKSIEEITKMKYLATAMGKMEEYGKGEDFT
jgi:hypothetical protein